MKLGEIRMATVKCMLRFNLNHTGSYLTAVNESADYLVLPWEGPLLPQDTGYWPYNDSGDTRLDIVETKVAGYLVEGETLYIELLMFDETMKYLSQQSVWDEFKKFMITKGWQPREDD